MEPGSVKVTYGTGCFCLLCTGREPVKSRNRLLTTVAWDLGSGLEYALEGSVFIGGAVVQWLRDELRILSSAAESDIMSRSVPDTGGVYFVPAFVGLGAPYWDPDARGALFGLTRGSRQEHIVRAGMESRRGARDPVGEGGRRRVDEHVPPPVPGRHPGHAPGAPAQRGDNGTRRGFRRRAVVRHVEELLGAFRNLEGRCDIHAVDDRYDPRRTDRGVERRGELHEVVRKKGVRRVQFLVIGRVPLLDSRVSVFPLRE